MDLFMFLLGVAIFIMLAPVVVTYFALPSSAQRERAERIAFKNRCLELADQRKRDLNGWRVIHHIETAPAVPMFSSDFEAMHRRRNNVAVMDEDVSDEALRDLLIVTMGQGTERSN